MRINDVKQSIYHWTRFAVSNNSYDIALLKVWVRLEKYLGFLFLNYSLGKPSELGYSPRLKLKFSDESHFNAFMREGTKKYVDYLGRIEKLSGQIFYDNPFEVIISDQRRESFDQMKYLRHYIAHESEEAKSKVVQRCFAGDPSKFIEPNDYLKSKPKGSKNTHFTIYMNTIEDILEIVNDEIDSRVDFFL